MTTDSDVMDPWYMGFAAAFLIAAPIYLFGFIMGLIPIIMGLLTIDDFNSIAKDGAKYVGSIAGITGAIWSLIDYHRSDA